jgi:hypothetical protein
MPYTDEGKALMLWNLAATISHVSLHSGIPEDGHELSGGVYRRMQIAFINPEDGSMRSEREVSFEVPAGARVTHAGFWNTSIGGTLLAWAPSTEHRFKGRGVYVVDLAQLGITSPPV